MRAKTSYTYNENIARDVIEEIPKFLEEVTFLIARLEQRLAR